jgi:hypothetical protein
LLSKNFSGNIEADGLNRELKDLRTSREGFGGKNYLSSLGTSSLVEEFLGWDKKDGDGSRAALGNGGQGSQKLRREIFEGPGMETAVEIGIREDGARKRINYE